MSVWVPAYSPPDWKAAVVSIAFRERGRASKVAYSARHRALNLAGERARDRAFYAGHREQTLTRKAAYDAGHREASRIYARVWYWSHREEHRVRKAIYNAAHTKERREYQQAWESAHPGNNQARHRRRREAPFVWLRMDPWPTDCQFCGNPIDPRLSHPSRLAGTTGHEPPIAWMLRHPGYDGNLVLRPEHWGCNIRKRDRPDWECMALQSTPTTIKEIAV